MRGVARTVGTGPDAPRAVEDHVVGGREHQQVLVGPGHAFKRHAAQWRRHAQAHAHHAVLGSGDAQEGSFDRSKLRRRLR
jgi:hypothetical protein